MTLNELLTAVEDAAAEYGLVESVEACAEKGAVVLRTADGEFVARVPVQEW